MVECYLGLGSNLGKRRGNIFQALAYLKQDPAIKVLKISSIIETKPQDLSPQPKFLNAVAKIETSYNAQKLLKRLQQIEVKLGRPSPHPKNHPRSIDLDILFYGDSKIDEENLKIPHPLIGQRDFVVQPLLEVAPELLGTLSRLQKGHFPD
ncbi:MAG: 2-amino-4-hydroxy-6-hydroxymethyldihydropteridine diphosphokinase [Candidatus Omnitrophica bacterium]|nr:2-amino-4-hydroxy-6-hydroxymethyldihydropteridine diphosphokinase [Candidatus Omnitrophota bacterium]